MTIAVNRGLLERLGLGDIPQDACADALAAIETRLASLTARGKNSGAALEEVIDEVMLAVPAVLHALGEAPAEEHDPWRHRRPDVSPTLAGSADGWVAVVSPLAGLVVTLDPSRREIYAKRSDLPAVVLQVPDSHTIDPRSIWCNDSGEIRVAFGAKSDLRWDLPSVPGARLLPYDKVLRRPRQRLRWVNERISGDSLLTLAGGRWVVDDEYQMTVTDRFDEEQSFELAPLYDGSHSNALNPHFTPDGSQLVAVYHAEDPHESGLAACSIGYFDAIVHSQQRTHEQRSWPWEFDIKLHQLTSPGTRASRVEDIGYDASSTRAALVDADRAHTFHVKAWAHLGSLERPDGGAVVETVVLPTHEAAALAWAGHSVIATAEGRAWRIDLLLGDGQPELLPAAEHQSPVVCVAPVGESVVVVHADRTVVGIQRDGSVVRAALQGESSIVAASPFADGRLLIATPSSLELWAGSRLVASRELLGSPIRGFAPCVLRSEWALAWHDDESLTVIRLGGRTISTESRLPHQPSGGFQARAAGAVMVDVDDWYLLGSSGGLLNDGEPYVAGVQSWTGLDAVCLTYMPAAGAVAAGTSSGVDFLNSPRDHQRKRSAIDLGVRVERLAAGECARSLVAASPGRLSFLRLLT